MATLSLNSSAPPSLQWPPNSSLSTLNTLENPNNQNPEEEEEEDAADPDKSENPNYSNPDSIMEPPFDFNSSIPSISTLFPNQNPDFNSNRQPRKTPDFLLHLGFNQDAGCFSVATDLGFQVFNSDPLTETFRRDFEGGGIGMVEMLFRSNIFALVGGGPNPLYPTTKVMLWEDDKDRFMAELSFRAPVKSVRLRRDRIVVVLEQKVYVYSFFDLRLLHQIDTMPNPKGLCAVSQSATGPMLVCPGLQKGQIRIENYGTRRTKLVMAHDSELACIAMSLEGNWVATASKKGTLIRIFNTKDGSLLQEVRRGADKADIYSLAFSPTAKWLAVSSDKGTIHVFSLKGNQELEGEQNSPTSTAEVSPATSSGPSFNGPLFFIRGVLPKYFSSEWSLAQFRLPDSVQSIVAFGHQKHTIMILGFDGSFYRCKFDPVAGGEMTQLEFHNFLKREETSS